MSKEISIYLDVIRVFAALLVVMAHFSFRRFTGESLNYFHQFGQTAVIIFFVLSGYVITYVVDIKEKTFKNYFISRFSRLYSVVLIALILVFVLDNIGHEINEIIYGGYYRDSNFLLRFLANILFLQQLWFFNISYLSDGPMWSLGYEFWYYVLFGFFIFIKGRKKYLFLIFTVFFIGPKILLLLPVWLFGVWIYYFHKNNGLNTHFARAMFFLAPVVFLCIFKYYDEINEFMWSVMGKEMSSKLGFSRGFITDYLTAFLIGVHILSAKYIDVSIFDKLLVRGEDIIRFFANSSFSIYLFHFPLLLFFGALFHHDPNSIIDIVILFIATLFACLMLAQVTEKKKYVYKKQITNIWNALEYRVTQ